MPGGGGSSAGAGEPMEETSQEEDGEEDAEEDAEVGDAEEEESGEVAPPARPAVSAAAVAGGAGSRPHLQPFGGSSAAGAAAAGQFDDGDSIVPSTPTLMVPRRGDAFAESVPSPQVRTEGGGGRVGSLGLGGL